MEERISWFHWMVGAMVLAVLVPVLLIPAATIGLVLLPIGLFLVPSVMLVGRS